ncbi:hypothetical protein A1O1_00754 [Capronia coronata CBS 617.96]|uniref:Uncharacterized protein n=1 Tax=Capronia coronata CBS 617.96 TaxID=1182541 RepID=W9YRV2_9EURO|nr:uncharacterized protein A1O1_00754 [Capronia coronata CBS 617.96]EXJ95632.1 hypothetical protein A1O1_00754 [Capronia coronata CBS 617.96]
MSMLESPTGASTNIRDAVATVSLNLHSYSLVHFLTAIVWSHLYSFSFEQNPDWTREYPGQEEILEYLMGIAQKYELYPYTRFNTAVDAAFWENAAKKWKTTVSIQGGKDAEFGRSYTVTSDFPVSGVGQLNVPNLPDILALDEFRGKLMHSARCDWSYYQRFPNWAIPRLDAPIPSWKRSLYRYVQ